MQVLRLAGDEDFNLPLLPPSWVSSGVDLTSLRCKRSHSVSLSIAAGWRLPEIS